MIEVIYRGRLGNRLFQYCCGRIMAQELGYALKADPIPSFPETAIKVDGIDHSDAPSIRLSEDFWSRVDIPTIIRTGPKRNIVLDGYFQNYSFYEPYRDVIRNKWLITNEPHLALIPNKNDLVMHVRRGDAVYYHGFTLPFSHYENILNNTEYDRLFILSDSPDDIFFSLFEKYQPTMVHNDALEDFCFIKSANKIAISLGTYSWWSAFLSDAQEIYFPVPIPCEYPWLPLKVPEKRYISVPCYDKYQRTVNENRKIAYFLTRKITRHLKNPKKFVSTVLTKATQ